MKYDNYTVEYYNRYPRIKINGKNVKLHVYVWEKVNGKKPKGFDIHHIDGDKKNYQIENLLLVTPSEHFRIHAGWVKTDGEWSHKPCKDCNQLLPLSDFYSRGKLTPSNLCKTCHNKNVISYQRKMKNKILNTKPEKWEKEFDNKFSEVLVCDNPDEIKDFIRSLLSTKDKKVKSLDNE